MPSVETRRPSLVISSIMVNLLATERNRISWPDPSVRAVRFEMTLGLEFEDCQQVRSLNIAQILGSLIRCERSLVGPFCQDLDSGLDLRVNAKVNYAHSGLAVETGSERVEHPVHEVCGVDSMFHRKPHLLERLLYRGLASNSKSAPPAVPVA